MSVSVLEHIPHQKVLTEVERVL